jgi:hypothetical protein
MRVNPDSGVCEFLLCKAELASPTTDWELSWFLCRHKGLPPDLSSFFWKLLLGLLCSQQRLHENGVSPYPLCRLCKNETGTLIHELLEYSYNGNTGQELLTSHQHQIPSLTAVTLNCIWKERNTSSRVCAYQVWSELEQTIAMLRTSRLSSAAEILSNISEQLFH